MGFSKRAFWGVLIISCCFFTFNLQAEMIGTDLLIQEGDSYGLLEIVGQPELENTPQIIMTGGHVDGMLTLGGSSVNMSGGEIDSLNCIERSSVTITEGHVQELMAGSPGSMESHYPTVNINGGQMDMVSVWPHSSLSMTDGEVAFMQVGSDIPVNITGGHVGNLYSGYYQSAVHITNSIVDFRPEELEPMIPFGEIKISNSFITELAGFGNVNIEITGGVINPGIGERILMRENSSLEVLLPDHKDNFVHTELRQIIAIENSLVELHAGLIEEIVADHDSLIKIYGYDFEYFSFEELGSNGGVLFGHWADDTPMQIAFSFPDPTSVFSEHVILIPEPATLLLISLGGVVMLRKKR